MEYSYLPVLSSSCQFAIDVERPLPGIVAPRLTEVVPVFEGYIYRGTHDILLHYLELYMSSAAG
jgi:hypothetical protein